MGTDWKGPGYFAKAKGSYEGCHDQMHFTYVLSGHCVEGNKETSRRLAWGHRWGCSGVNRTFTKVVRRACNKNRKGDIETPRRLEP